MRTLPHLEMSYCTNVHPGEGIESLMKLIESDLPKIKAEVSAHQPFGSGLRLGAQSVYALSDNPQAILDISQAMRDRDLYVFSVNGFPYGDFAAPSVKERVYEPDWSSEERVRYTLSLARLMTQLPGPQMKTISTVAGGFVPSLADQTGRDDEYRRRFSELSIGLFELEEETGVSIRVALEPEPWTRLESVAQVIPFFEEVVWPSSPHAHKYIGVCYDTCHQALAFEDPIQSWTQLTQAQVPIYKVQISNALSLTQPANLSQRAKLLDFAEPRYLHQVTAQTASGELLRALDLPHLTSPSLPWINAEEWRCHFHVPIWWRGSLSIPHERDSHQQDPHQASGLGTTADHWRGIASIIRDPSAQAHLCAEHPLHVEVETYSWHVLPDSLKSRRGLHAEVIRELLTLRDVLHSDG